MSPTLYVCMENRRKYQYFLIEISRFATAMLDMLTMFLLIFHNV